MKNHVQRSVYLKEKSMEIKTKEEFYKEFFNEITSVCEATGITHRELAEKAGLTEVSLSRYINGHRGISLYNAYKLMRVLNVTKLELE